MRILLHVCCGVCAAGVTERLKEEGCAVTGFFYKPNIFPEDEYRKRLDAAREAYTRMGFELVEGEYEHGAWKRRVRGHENTPEGGTRCRLCFEMRLEKTREYFSTGRYDLFGTTLTVSPHKHSDTVNSIGRETGGAFFLSADFKKEGGFKKTIELSKKWGLYRQDYCGCEYSRRAETEQ